MARSGWRYRWFFVAVFGYLAVQTVLYAEETAHPQVAETPWEHLTLEAALALAVGVQYRENRAKEAMFSKMASDASAAIERATQTMLQVTTALERLAEKVDDMPRPRRTD
jgi:hypothetical protein